MTWRKKKHVHSRGLEPEPEPESLGADMDADLNSEVSCLPRQSESKTMQCMNNYQDNDFVMEHLSEDQAMNANDSFEVDKMDCWDMPSSVPQQDCPEDTAEYSSSFGETYYGSEYNLGMSDAEVESTYAGVGISGSFNNGYGDVFALRKKKLTDHWRTFMQPLRWHSKWLELQMKESNAQAMKYDNALTKCEQWKQLSFESLHCGDIDSKSACVLAQVKGEKVMKRRKRKRMEDTVDLASYMSHHNLFSFYDKKSQSDVCPVESCSGNLGTSFCKVKQRLSSSGLEESLYFENGTNSLEQLLAKIEMVLLRIRKVKGRIEKVISENPAKFASLNRLSIGMRDPLSDAFRDDASPPPDGSMSSMYVASNKVARMSRVNSLEPVIVGLHLKNPTTSLHAIKIPNRENGGGSIKEVKIGSSKQSEVAKEEPINEDELMRVSSGKIGEQPGRHKAESVSASGVGSNKPAGSPLHLEDSNKRTTSTAKTYSRKHK